APERRIYAAERGVEGALRVVHLIVSSSRSPVSGISWCGYGRSFVQLNSASGIKRDLRSRRLEGAHGIPFPLDAIGFTGSPFHGFRFLQGERQLDSFAYGYPLDDYVAAIECCG